MFLSPYSNRREDEYGGSLENRMRFPLEVLNAMLAEAGNIPIVLRLTVDDMLPGGIELAEGCEMARRFCAAGAAAIQASGGTQERIWNISPCYRMKEGYLIPAARAVKQVVDKPVIALGKLGDPKTGGACSGVWRGGCRFSGQTPACGSLLAGKGSERGDGFDPALCGVSELLFLLAAILV